MKKLLSLLLFALLLVSFSYALPDNYNPPVMTMNGGLGSITIGFGADTEMYGAAGTTLYVETLSGNTLYSLPLGAGNVIGDGMYFPSSNYLFEYHSGTSSGKTFNTVGVYDASDPLNIQLVNFTGCDTGGVSNCLSTGAFFYDDKAFVNGVGVGDTQGYVMGSHVREKNFSDIITGLDTVYDVVDTGTQRLYLGRTSSPNGVVVFDEDYNILMNVSAVPSGVPILVDSSRAILSDGTVVNIGGYTIWNELGVKCGNNDVQMLDAFGQEYIVGINTTSGNFIVCDISNIGDVKTEDTGINSGGSSAYKFSDGIVRVPSRTNGPKVWDLQAPSNINIESNNLPSVFHEFIGVDENEENFVFRLRMSDVEGGQLFYSQKVESFGTGGNTSFFDSINFNDVNDLSSVSNIFCPDSFNITFSSPFAPFGTDGLLLFNSSLCLWPTTIDVPDVTSGDTGLVTVSTSIGWDYISPSNIQSSSYSIYDVNNDLVEQLLFDMDFSNNQLNISYSNGTLIATDNNLAPNRIYTITADMDFVSNSYTITMASNLGQVFSITNNLVRDSLGSVAFNEYSNSDLLTYVDYVAVDYNVGSNEFNPYVSFGLLGPGGDEQKAIYWTIPASGFGDYESYVYGTDQVAGTSFYENPHYITFTYNSNTPVLTQEQIDGIIGGEDFVEGDIATDLFPNLLSGIGVKTATSRFIVGLVILILVLITLASYDTLIALFGGAATMIILSLPAVGLWPTWSLAILVVVAAGIVAVGFRKIVSGGG